MIRPYTRILRKQGFTLNFVSRGVTSIRCFSKQEGNRVLTVQLWSDGNHRVAHATVVAFGTHSTTKPTEFHSVEAMKLAIKYEWLRPSSTARGQ